MLADLSDQIIDGLPDHWPALAQEEVRRTGITALLTFSQPGAQSAQFISFYRLMGQLPENVSSRLRSGSPCLGCRRSVFSVSCSSAVITLYFTDTGEQSAMRSNA